MNKTNHLDDLDIEILKILEEDCRMSYTDMSIALGCTYQTAHNRIRILENLGYIKGYSIIIDEKIKKMIEESPFECVCGFKTLVRSKMIDHLVDCENGKLKSEIDEETIEVW